MRGHSPLWGHYAPLSEVVSIASRRGLTHADCMSHNDLQRLRLKYGLEWSSAYEEMDLSKIKDDAATEDVA